MYYYITGIAGTGKSAVGNKLKEQGFSVYDLDAVPGLCHWENKETGEEAKYSTGVGKEWLEAHSWICDVQKLREILNKHRDEDVFVVGIASNHKHLLPLFSKVFLLYCSEQTFIHRLNNRNEGNGFGKDASEQEHILSWAREFEAEAKSTQAIPLNTDQPLEKVVKLILTQISS